MSSAIFRFFICFVCWNICSLYGAIRGKVDLGPAYISIDVLKSGKTEKTLRMGGVKGDATLLVYQGLCLKPGFLFGWGHGELSVGTLAVGYYLPLFEKFKILPHVGVTFSYLRTTIDIETEIMTLCDQRERFRSSSPFVGMEFCYTLAPRWTLVGIYQYAWSHTHTKISSKEFGTVVSDKSHSDGPNYSLGVDYSVNDNWSICFGVGYNITLSKEKHGLRGKGIKLGVIYYF